MWKFSDISLIQVNRTFCPVSICAQFDGKRGQGVRILTWPLFIFFAVAQFLSTPDPAHGQQQSFNVLVDSSFRVPGERFMEELHKTLVSEASEAVRFALEVVPTVDIPAMLQQKRWEIAILSTFALTSMSTQSAATAFEMPFVFPNMRSIIDLQRSHVGLAGLSTMSGQEMTGLVYLNAGVTLLTGRGEPKSPDDLKGRKVAVNSLAQFQSLQNIGSFPVTMSRGDVMPALMSGNVDSIVINSGSPDTWALPEGGFLLRDSVQAQVAVVVTNNKTWDRIPFVYRAMIGDAAIAVSLRFDNSLVETENELLAKVESYGLSLVTFQSEDVSRATLQWISSQPEARRGIYSSVYDHIETKRQKNPRNPLIPGRSGVTGKLYFATTREDTGHRRIRYRFGDSRTDTVKCGQIAFSPSNPSPTRATIVGAVTAGNKACGTYIDAALQSSKRMLIFVHGFNNRFFEAAKRAMTLKNALGNDTEVVLWSWPSKRDGLSGNYDYDKESVGGRARTQFRRLLKALKKGSESTSLNILAHSMGSWHTVGVMSDLSDDTARPRLHHIVLAAPDVPRDEFKFALDDMRRVANRITLYACGWDWALKTSKIINDYPRAGTGGDRNIVVSDMLESVDVDARWLSTNHSYVFETGSVLSDLTALIQTDAKAGARGLLQKPKAPWHYWSFP